ncbi:PREDICTED: protein TPX2-like [Fragaria vesca subsp. vesca]
MSPMHFKKGDLLIYYEKRREREKCNWHIHVSSGESRQKLDAGRSRQTLNPKPQTFLHKSKLGHTSATHFSTAIKTQKEDRTIDVREPATPFVSMAEMMNRFQSSTRDLPLPHANGSLSHMKPKLTLTRPKEPEFETSQRVRSS